MALLTCSSLDPDIDKNSRMLQVSSNGQTEGTAYLFERVFIVLMLVSIFAGAQSINPQASDMTHRRVVLAGSVIPSLGKVSDKDVVDHVLRIPALSHQEPGRLTDAEVDQAKGSGLIRVAGAPEVKSTGIGTKTTYTIYSPDGKLYAEYDESGVCTKEFLYAGDTLIAEYDSATDTYFYHINDQIRSNRLIIDDNGEVVRSIAYGPFGESIVSWIDSYDSRLRFSGKEREETTGQDYFGLRYYDSGKARFISVDPVMNRPEALVNTQLWNLYSYSRNNPLNFFDPDGGQEEPQTIYLMVHSDWNTGGRLASDIVTQNRSLRDIGSHYRIELVPATRGEFERIIRDGGQNDHLVVLSHSYMSRGYIRGISLQLEDHTYSSNDRFSTSLRTVALISCASRDYASSFVHLYNGHILTIKDGAKPGRKRTTNIRPAVAHGVVTGLADKLSMRGITNRATKAIRLIDAGPKGDNYKDRVVSDLDQHPAIGRDLQ
jgi:RHS repeat-associated protein